jgi:hypothetical protein
VCQLILSSLTIHREKCIKSVLKKSGERRKLVWKISYERKNLQEISNSEEKRMEVEEKMIIKKRDNSHEMKEICLSIISLIIILIINFI